MKKPLFLSFFALWALLSACNDQCEQTRVYKAQVPVNYTAEQIRQGINLTTKQELTKAGKIYVRGNYLFINELKKGLHVYDNSNPQSPQKIAFVAIPGNADMAVKDHILYADSYMDLVALDISNPGAIKEVSRVKDVYQNGTVEGLYWYYNAQTQTLTDYEEKWVTQKIKTNCDDGGEIFPVYADKSTSSPSTSTSTGGTTSSGSGSSEANKGGSMARFTVVNNYLYSVTQSSMELFDIKEANKPQRGKKINLGWGIETIFPYQDKLFIGSTTGMYIFDNSTPENPKQLSIFNHARACDPVVVEGNTAYVTLRNGTRCAGNENILSVVDVSNLLKPVLVKNYPMQNPHGLGIDGKDLFICEGQYGLKSLDASDITNIRLLQQIDKIDAYDVILLDKNHLLMVGKNGLYQYDYSNPLALKQLSVIPVINPNP